MSSIDSGQGQDVVADGGEPSTTSSTVAPAVVDNAQGPLLASSEEQTTLSVKTKRYANESADDGPFGDWFRKHRTHVIVFTYSGRILRTAYPLHQ